MKKLIAMMMLAVVMVGCQKRDKIESTFMEYAETEKIPNFNGISSIECVDTMSFTDKDPISIIENQIDSVNSLLKNKVEKMTEYYGNLSYSKKQQLALEFARIGAETGELWVNDTKNDDTIDELKDALDTLSPYKEPLYMYHIIAKVGNNDISFYGFACGEDITFVKADELSDAMKKNEKLVNLQDAMMSVIRTKLVPHTILIDDIDKMMGVTNK